MESLLQDILKKINRKDLAPEIDKAIYRYVSNLKTFLTRLFEICYNKPLSDFNTQPLEVLLYFISQKKDDLKKCYPVLSENNIYFKLKSLPSKKEYEKIIDILALLGEEIAMKYNLPIKYKKYLNVLQPKYKETSSNIEAFTHKTSKNVKLKTMQIFTAIMQIITVGLLAYTIFLLKNIEVSQYSLEKQIEEIKTSQYNLESQISSLTKEIENLKETIKVAQNNLEKQIVSLTKEIENFKKNHKNTRYKKPKYRK
jgi:ribosomal protein S15P/S13E